MPKDLKKIEDALDFYKSFMNDLSLEVVCEYRIPHKVVFSFRYVLFVNICERTFLFKRRFDIECGKASYLALLHVTLEVLKKAKKNDSAVDLFGVVPSEFFTDNIDELCRLDKAGYRQLIQNCGIAYKDALAKKIVCIENEIKRAKVRQNA